MPKKVFPWLVLHKEMLLVGILFCCLLFFRFAFLEQRLQFSWDEVNNAWAAKDILIDHKMLLLGMPAKLNSGISIGPLYYYFVAIFYWIFHMDPIASGVIAGVTSIITFFGLYIVNKRIFNTPVALLVILLYTCSFAIISADRFQWPVDFIALFSALIFYFLYKVLTDSPTYFLGLAIALGLSFHIHFTSIFYPILVALALPFVKWNKYSIRYFLLSLPLFGIWFLPQGIYEIQHNFAEVRSLFTYNSGYNHGFHLQRMLQIGPDMFFEFTTLIPITLPIVFSYLVYLAFSFVYLWKNIKRSTLIFIGLTALWILVPWVIFSLYNGELTAYYFSTIRPIALFAAAYLLYRLFIVKQMIAKLATIIIVGTFMWINIDNFLTAQYQGLSYHRAKTLEAIHKGETIQFTEGVPESYMYYMYTHGYGLK